MSSRFLYSWFFQVLAWLSFAYLTSAILLSNIMVFTDVLDIREAVLAHPITAYWVSYKQFIEASLFGISFGTMFAFINYWIEKMGLHRLSFGQIVLLKTVLYFLALLIFATFMWVVMGYLNFFPKEEMLKLDNARGVFIFMVVVGIYFSIFILLLNFLLQISRKFGPSIIIPMLLGKYQSPQIEHRAFLFIDLKSSTAFAEELGHLRYSRLIRDCFQDLNQVLPTYRAEVYQYVGDEAVLTWKSKEALKKERLVNLFYAFKHKLEKRKAHYLKEYGLVPVFKAGANLGEVSVTEIGDYKREIAYHGDVLNTTSRIQGQCNYYQEDFLISEQLYQEISSSVHYQSDFVDQITLKGKSQDIKIYSLRQKETTVV